MWLRLAVSALKPALRFDQDQMVPANFCTIFRRESFFSASLKTNEGVINRKWKYDISIITHGMTET